MGIGLVEGLAEERDIPAHAFGLHDLNAGCGLRHYDGDRNAQTPAMIAQPLGVIPGGCRDHAPRALFLVEMEQRIERAAFLVCGCELVIFELEPDVGPGNFRQGLRAQHRRPDHGTFDTRSGSAHIVEGKELGRLGGSTDGRCFVHVSGPTARRHATQRPKGFACSKLCLIGCRWKRALDRLK